jgi:molybdopterin converting factor subunit 1
MKVKVKFFAILREKAGAGEFVEDVVAGMTVGELWTSLQQAHPGLAVPGLRLLYAVNQSYVGADHVLQEKDEVVFVPPVSGG